MSLFSPTMEPDKKDGEIHLINPSLKEFKTSYLDNKNNSVEVILAPLETKAFPVVVGAIILNHLVDFILNQGGFSYKTDVKLEKEAIRKKCVLYE